MAEGEDIEQVADESRDELVAILHELERRGRQAVDPRALLERQWPTLVLATAGVVGVGLWRRRRSRPAPGVFDRWRQQGRRRRARARAWRALRRAARGRLVRTGLLAAGELVAIQLARARPGASAPPS